MDSFSVFFYPDLVECSVQWGFYHSQQLSACDKHDLICSKLAEPFFVSCALFILHSAGSLAMVVVIFLRYVYDHCTTLAG